MENEQIDELQPQVEPENCKVENTVVDIGDRIKDDLYDWHWKIRFFWNWKTKYQEKIKFVNS